MVCRAVGVTFLTLCLCAICVAQFPQRRAPFQGPPGQTNWNSTRNISSINGSVLGSDNQPVGNVRVELRDSRTGTLVTAVYTGVGGTFEFGQLPQGSYEVVAFSGVHQVEERVDLSSMNAYVNLRMPGGTPVANDGNSKQTVSVAQYKVPEAARQELKKAREATLKSKINEAQQHVEKALAIDPDYADALTLRAIIKLDAKDSDGAIADLHKAIQSDGSYAMAYMVLGSALNVLMKYDDAIRVLERGESLAPDAWQVYFELGRAYAGKAAYESAIRALDRAQTLAPQEFPLIHLIRGQSMMALARYGDAIIELQAYLQKSPAGPDAEHAQKMLEKAKQSMEAAQK